MNFNYLPSLGHMSLLKVAVMLWNKHSLHYEYSLNNLERFWLSKRNEAREIIDNLPLSIRIRETLMTFYKAMYLEISLLIGFICDYVPNQYISICIRDVIWTSIGTVDKKKTAEVLVRNENLPINVRYELACIYCIQSEVVHLYQLLPEDNNYQHFFSEDLEYELLDNDDNVYKHNKLIVAWTHALRKGQVNFSYLFQYAVIHGNKVAAGNLFVGSNLSLTRYVIDAISFNSGWRRIYFLDVLTLLLEEMNVDELTELLHSKEIEVLEFVLYCLRHWPWNYCFDEILGCACVEFYNEGNCQLALNLFFKPRKENHDTCIFKDALFYFENIFPEKFPSLIRNCDHENLLVHIIKANDIESLELALKYLPQSKKINFFRKWRNVFCKYMTNKNDFSVLDVIRREFASSKYIIKEYETNTAKLRNEIIWMFK